MPGRCHGQSLEDVCGSGREPLLVGDEGVEAGVRRVHSQLSDLLRHEHASLALAQRCSGVAAPTPLFSALLNYRHSSEAVRGVSEDRRRAWKGIGKFRGGV